MNRVRTTTSSPASPGSRDASAWRFPLDLESELTTLAAICQVKQQQRDPVSSSIQKDDDDVDNPAEDEECTSRFSSSSLEDDTDVKKGFLDRLAELLCYRKDPTLITSTALIYNDEEATIFAARNSSLNGQNTWSSVDKEMLEHLSKVLARMSSNGTFECDPLPGLQRILVDYYSQRIRYHAQNIMRIEGGKTGLRFFKEDGCGGVASGRLDVHEFVQNIEILSHSTDFYAKLKSSLTPKTLQRVVDELAFIRRPMRSAKELLLVVRQCSGFRNVKIVLLDGVSPRNVKAWPQSVADIPLEAQLRAKIDKEAKKKKHVHAEMMLLSYLLGLSSSEVFPYLGISKKTCLLCGYILEGVGQFKTRENHGKCYSQWTLPSLLWTKPGAMEKLDKAVQRLTHILRDKATEKAIHRDAEKESVLADPIPPKYGRETTIFNAVVEDPRLGAREAEWLATLWRDTQVETTSGEDEGSAMSELGQGASALHGGNDSSEKAIPEACRFCKAAGKLTHTCTKCGITAYCHISCYRAHWYQHKFSCNLGRPIDVTDHLVLAYHTNHFPQDDDIGKQYGFMCFTSAKDRWRLFNLYRRLVVDWAIDEDELRTALKQNRLKEMLICRCQQTGDPVMFSDKLWLESQEAFEANGEGPGWNSVFKAAQEELLDPDDRALPLSELVPREKLAALLFYIQIRNGYKIDVDEDNWISLGFCTAPDAAAEGLLVSAYACLVERCKFDEFWRSMAKSGMVELFSKYGLADQILRMRNFKSFMNIVKKWYQSVWELKRFTRMSVSDPFRAVVVDYGFMNCESAHQRMQLRTVYQKYFERGEDEMRLHEACVAGRLASFLQLVFDGLPVAPELLKNPYPLVNCPLAAQAGMVIESVVYGPESAVEQARAKTATAGDECMVIPIPDDEFEAMKRTGLEKAAFLGTGMRKRISFAPNGKTVEELSLM